MDFGPAHLRCEYLTNPLGIHECNPRLSWIVESDVRGQVQTAYRILVASSPDLLAKNKGDLWDSGRVASDETTAVVYGGRPLTSRMRCWWKVKIWGRGGAVAWSDPAQWSMGLLKPSDWEAEWIGFDKPRREAKPKGAKKRLLPPASYLQKNFAAEKPVVRATLYSTSLGIHVMYLNGRRVAREFFNPGWTRYGKRVYYRTYDVTGMVKEGGNAVAAALADGWFAGHVGYLAKRDSYGQHPRLLARLEIEYDDGTRSVIGTDHTWRATEGAIREADFLMGERYDARREIPGWATPHANLKTWSRVRTGAGIRPVLQAAPHQPVEVFAEHTPKSSTEPGPGVFVLDMGTNFAGFVRLRVRGPRGKKVTLRFGERLQKDGTVYTRNLRAARSTDVYVCKGEGLETYEPMFTFHGFQYVQITGYPGKLAPGSVTGIELTSATPVAGDFSCSSPMLQQLYRNVCQTQRSNFIDIPTDCPQRDERLGWTGDAQVYIRTATSNTDVHAFFKKWLVDLNDAQRDDGQYPMVAPLEVAGSDGGPAWADAGVICPWTIYEVYGDTRLLDACYPGMKRFVEFCRKRSTGDLLPPKQYHCFGDWLSIKADTPKDVIYTAYFACSTRLLARAADVLGRKRDAVQYENLFQRIRKAFNKAYVGKDGRISGDTQTSYVLAIQYDLLDDELLAKAAGHLVGNIEARGNHLSTGFVGTRDIMTALRRVGRTDVAYRLLMNETFPSWGYSIKHGATSIWERWDGWTAEKGFQTPRMNSFAHYAYGAVYQWMVETIGGIQSATPGFKRIIIKPEPGGKLTRAKTRYDSIHGTIQTEWRRKGARLTLDVKIPANTTAEIHIPAARAESVTEGGVRIGRAEGVKYRGMSDGSAVLEVGSGLYRFVVTPS